MRIASDRALDLTYCTNIHPAGDWDGVFANLQRYGPALRDRLAPGQPFGIGLRLSARDARDLLTGDRLAALRTFLDDQGLYVALINGFPYGPFHHTTVKADVYAPDWQHEARATYTGDLFRILAALVPEGMDGGVSTSPLTYKAWLDPASQASAMDAMAASVARIAADLAHLKRERGIRLHLDIEPEPDCALETSVETIAFFERALLPVGAPIVARALGVGAAEAERAIREHVQICFDCCHFAVEFEDPAAALDRLAAAGIGIGRVQLSSAVDVHLPAAAADQAPLRERLARFADPIYLHQVVERSGEAFHHYPDLDQALDAGDDRGARQWRIHFHVPLFTQAYEGLRSTQDYVARVLTLAHERAFTTHLEIETYTWDVLPAALKIDLLDSIEREYRWVLGELGAGRRALGAGREALGARRGALGAGGAGSNS